MSAGGAAAAGATEFVFPTTPSPSQSANWAGFYLEGGGSGSTGGSWMNLGNSSSFSSPGLLGRATDQSFGYNFQKDNLVFGLGGSLAAANFDGKFTAPFLPGTGGWSPNMNWLSTVTGHVGYSFGQWLPYLKGGFVSAGVGGPENGIAGFTQSSTEHAGWTAGVGLEYQLSSKWSLGLEYLYTDIEGAGPQGSAPIGGAPEVYSTALKTQSLIGRLNYKAGW